jgi:transcriptional regulator with XRE-family HTH domain
MTEPNTALRAARAALLMSQDDLARAVRAAGDRAGEPNGCSKRDVQRWEAGSVQMPRGDYARALEAVCGVPIENLGFQGAADRRYGMNRREALAMAGAAGAAVIPFPEDEGKDVSAGPLTGIWKSHYEYVSSGRGNETYSSEHYCVILHRGARLQLRSLPGTAEGKVMMDLTVNGQVITGTWTEQTDATGYYAGSVYHGAIQMLVDPTGHRMTGKWAGFGRDYEINTGPWTLELVSADTGKEAMAKYNRPVDASHGQPPAP